jgi:regulator of cell morphogenesis and NO signaling
MQMTLAELAIHIPASIHLFEKYDLNYYQNGKQSFREACEEKELVYTKIDFELAQIQSKPSEINLMTLVDMSIDRLIDFLNGQYHANETQILTSIHNSIRELAQNTNCPKTLCVLISEIEPRFKALMDKLIQHCEKEDKLLFPYMRKLSDLKRDRLVKSSSQNITLIKNPIRVLEAEHEQAAYILAEIKKKVNNYTIPDDAPKEYEKLMKNLLEFEKDLHMHLHIENNILFPKIIELEEELNNRIK